MAKHICNELCDTFCHIKQNEEALKQGASDYDKLMRINYLIQQPQYEDLPLADEIYKIIMEKEKNNG